MRLLNIAFDLPIKPWEIPAFRGAVISKVGFDHDLYHNHNNQNGLDAEQFLHRYPLIQYKQHQGKPMLICLNEGVEALQHLFEQPDLNLRMGSEQRSLRVARLDVRHHSFDSQGKMQLFHLRDWLALNEVNYEAYRQCQSLLEQVALLEKILQNQLVALCYAFDHQPQQPVRAQIQELKSRRWVDYKEMKMYCFSIVFSANIALPDFIGLGKGASTGWGVIRRLK